MAKTRSHTVRRPERRPFQRFFSNLGPGLITGAADDDPSGISTYIVLALAMALGIALTYVGLIAIKLLFTTAVINGVLAPPLILIVLLLTRDQTVMGD
jgi:Mn2+/Fe2+ NRAMP family transporter